ncbi:MAG: FKBP-type peptidyl-prolyl cis-trans isomerase, partial [Methanosarcinales archaeon]
INILETNMKKNILLLILLMVLVSGCINPNNTEEVAIKHTIVLKNNPVNQTIQTMFGPMKISFNNTTIIMDSNHPLAGKTLIFDIKVVNISSKNTTVNKGDLVSVDYIGRLENGEVFDTSYEDLAKNESIPKTSDFQIRTKYEPLEFKVGAGQMILGFDKAVVGMEIGEEKTVKLPPEEAYGPRNPRNIRYVPIIQEIPDLEEFPKTEEIPKSVFRRYFGKDPIVQDTLPLPRASWNVTVIKVTDTNVTLEHDLKIGEKIQFPRIPWNETVVGINEVNITVRHDLKIGEVFQYPGAPWNTTVIDIY